VGSLLGSLSGVLLGDYSDEKKKEIIREISLLINNNIKL
jgi:hypothetical protein